MLSAKGLLDALAQENVSTENYKNDDHDFGEVLRTCRIGEPKTRGHMLRYADGQERAFSFDDNYNE